MNFGSPFSGLFATGATDPRDYIGSQRRTERTSPPRANSASLRRAAPSVPGTTSPVSCDVCVDGVVKSLDNFDASASRDLLLLNSPRSLSACRKLGILPEQLLRTSLEQCRRDMISAGEDVSDETVVELRFNYLCRRRQQKFEAAVAERERIMLSALHHDVTRSSSPSSTHASIAHHTSTMILEDERRLKRIITANVSRTQQQLLHAELRAKQREKEDARLREAHAQDEDRQRERRELERKKEKCEEEAHRLRLDAQILEREEALKVAELKRQEYEAKDDEIKMRITARTLLIQARNDHTRRQNAERRDAMLREAARILAEKKEKFQARWREFDETQEELRKRREADDRRRQIESKMKQEEIEEIKLRSAMLLEAKIRRTLRKEERSVELMEERKDEVQGVAEKKAAEDAANEAKRAAVYDEAQQRDRERVHRLLRKIRLTDEHIEVENKRRAAQSRLRSEILRQKQLDKLECADRSKRADAAAREDLMNNIDQKCQRVENMKEQREDLKRRRQELRREAERTRVSLVEPSPGPLDYVADTLAIGKAGPKWKFGMPASALGARQVSKSVPAANYFQSPGPAQYSPIRRGRTPAYSIARSSRWAAADASTSASSTSPMRPHTAPLS